jgi:hypothetical protein
MVAASKMRKTQDRMAASRPYADTMRKVIGHLANGNLEYKHPYLAFRADHCEVALNAFIGPCFHIRQQFFEQVNVQATAICRYYAQSDWSPCER